MWPNKTALVASAVLLWTAPALAAPPTEIPILTQMAHNGYLKFQISSGRISVGGRRFGNINTSSTSGSRTEKLSIRVSNDQPLLNYVRSTAKEDFSIEVVYGGKLRIRRQGKEDSTIVRLDFSQAPGEPTSLTLGPQGQEQIYRARGLWHLLITRRQPCREHLIPILQLLHPQWRLAESADAVEAELLRMAAAGETPDRQQWAALVAQLADDRFARREAADRQLRLAGQAVLSYLQQIDFSQLEAEQQFRIRRIIRSLSQQTAGDVPEAVAQRLIADRNVWLALLSRSAESTRRQAAARLEAMLGEPIAFDPAAEEATRETQIERLRVRLGRDASEGGNW